MQKLICMSSISYFLIYVCIYEYNDRHTYMLNGLIIYFADHILQNIAGKATVEVVLGAGECMFIVLSFKN